MKVIAIIQARMGSKRLPGKVMLELNGMPVIELMIRRLASSKTLNKIVVATSSLQENEILVKHLNKLEVDYIQGDENDVLSRFNEIVKKYNPDIVVRLTADCPLVDPKILDLVVNDLLQKNVDYSSNAFPPTFADGMDVEAMRANVIAIVSAEATTLRDREHVTTYIRESGGFSTSNIYSNEDHSNLRLTLDEEADVEVIRNVVTKFNDIYFTYKDVIKLYEINPQIFSNNIHIKRNQGSNMSTSNKLWNRALSVIPSGNSLLSKNPEMHLPEYWPTYYEKAKGCQIWDLDGKSYIDMSIMGVGTNILGYADDEIDEAVITSITKSNMSTLNCPEEVYLAEKLIELHPWANMVKFARTGGEANAIAIRIARAHTESEKVAICGYHGWHDWYLAANLGNSNDLNNHLIEGLEISGVPRSLRGSLLTFKYNNYDEFVSLVEGENIKIVMMEVCRNFDPVPDYIQRIREYTIKKGIVLIFDECTSGFRESFGGLHLKYGINPDITVLGKALGNGYAITAVLGTKEVMEASNKTFISSTFWTERIGFVAGLATLHKMERLKSWELIKSKGTVIKNKWKEISVKYSLPIEIYGLDALCGFSFKSENHLIYKTYITQEMLKRGYLAGVNIYVSLAHTDEIIDQYFNVFEKVFESLADNISQKTIHNVLDGRVVQAGFKRLN